MTTEQVTQIIKIMCTADGECNICAGRLVNKFIMEFPEYSDLSLDVYNKYNDSDYNLADLRDM